MNLTFLAADKQLITIPSAYLIFLGIAFFSIVSMAIILLVLAYTLRQNGKVLNDHSMLIAINKANSVASLEILSGMLESCFATILTGKSVLPPEIQLSFTTHFVKMENVTVKVSVRCCRIWGIREKIEESLKHARLSHEAPTLTSDATGNKLIFTVNPIDLDSVCRTIASVISKNDESFLKAD